MLVTPFLPFLTGNSFPEPVPTSPSPKASSKVLPGPSGSLDVNKLEVRCSPSHLLLEVLQYLSSPQGSLALSSGRLALEKRYWNELNQRFSKMFF